MKKGLLIALVAGISTSIDCASYKVKASFRGEMSIPFLAGNASDMKKALKEAGKIAAAFKEREAREIKEKEDLQRLAQRSDERAKRVKELQDQKQATIQQRKECEQRLEEAEKRRQGSTEDEDVFNGRKTYPYFIFVAGAVGLSYLIKNCWVSYHG
jgi:hypothetical protein